MLAKWMVQMMKRGLCKYGLQKGCIRNWDMYLPWLAMGSRFSRHASLASFSLYFLLFSCDPKLLISIQCDVMVVVRV